MGRNRNRNRNRNQSNLQNGDAAPVDSDVQSEDQTSEEALNSEDEEGVDDLENGENETGPEETALADTETGETTSAETTAEETPEVEVTATTEDTATPTETADLTDGGAVDETAYIDPPIELIHVDNSAGENAGDQTIIITGDVTDTSGTVTLAAEEEAAPEPEQDTPPVVPVDGSDIEGAAASPEVIDDSLTAKEPVVPEVVVAPVVEETPTPSEDENLSTSITISDEDSEVISTLKIRLNAFVQAVNIPGTEPEQFKQAGQLASAITKHVIMFPRKDVLDALLAFFVEHKNGAAARENHMKGSTFLGQKEEQQVGVLFSLFTDLANRQIVSISDASVLQVLKKQEIVSYFNRRINGLKQARAQRGD